MCRKYNNLKANLNQLYHNPICYFVITARFIQGNCHKSNQLKDFDVMSFKNDFNNEISSKFVTDLPVVNLFFHCASSY